MAFIGKLRSYFLVLSEFPKGQSINHDPKDQARLDCYSILSAFMGAAEARRAGRTRAHNATAKLRAGTMT